MKALKFLTILILPITVYISFTNMGWLTLLPLVVFFGFVPLLELLFNPDKQNLNKEQEEQEKENKLYTYILYTTVPVQLLFLGWFLWMMKDAQLTTIEYIGRISAMGLMCGVIGINVGHELGHRNNRFDEFLGEILLLTSLDTHFLPYHNAGHHFNVATPKDAATARKNEIVYLFWIRSHFQSYYQAWETENRRLKNSGRNWFHLQNRMLIYTICNILLLVGIFFLFGLNALLAFTAAAVFGILLLETVNYIEHYGLLRKQNEKGRYERVKRTHSWNSDHRIGMLMLFNLSRHSDHHYNGSKHYQLLKSLPESPQMPTGYPGMMLVALVPPLWFSIMNKKIQDI
ncbi:alkane 1-monooxygenase [Tenacibaculum discolor]|uniref:Alkane 1-monooxygenase n=1 Tax=Tenacibaculum discolor TaxID=361581 RepID=A0A2G1BTI0_9FLAO|nr:alkane 1-monooxygenase [Tenacibaculum discolor]MDP2541645.1 alkane 1-monooxygenase [Tenacibaculum discolor]PHN97347.1 alkane 1-monooxygenase [Tenacibaculum discolor]PHO01444.1 alkane 1-monooxygenase [Rhodobacteraceae bacterium 4F10]